MIIVVENMLKFKDEANKCPINNDYSKGKKHQGKDKKKDQGKMNMSKKVSEEKANQTYTPKEKSEPLSCWICVEDHYAKNFPLKHKLAFVEKAYSPYMELLQVMGASLEGESRVS
jgi:hypothetical protein